ncbi:NBS resistance-like protein [Hibiscus syriacus]|uniref:NBS resistance-like protein n=1 Tax=Hibiscus syriacus TaxID=106335 RepID=A0A6A2XCW7_HIBSY|nr:uncharacterized protein LOC120170453 [Hibiscus syriacus]KAE8673571.1 NBS resistance-like protein [Hibiscus syriacus]
MGEHIADDIQVLHEDQLVEEEEEEEEAEALSLCDFPLDLETKINPRNEQWHSPNHIRARPESSFEFRNDEKGSDMCPADDIIAGGKLVPFGGKTTHHILRKRSESLSDLRSSGNSSTKNSAALLRISRSLDSQKQNLRRSDTKEKSFDQSEVSPKKVVKPKWYVLVFGSVKFPPEMELNDIKSRQFRRNPSVMFSDDGKKAADNDKWGSDKSSSWGLLKALSCRDYTSIAVTSSFYLPQA